MHVTYVESSMFEEFAPFFHNTQTMDTNWKTDSLLLILQESYLNS